MNFHAIISLISAISTILLAVSIFKVKKGSIAGRLSLTALTLLLTVQLSFFLIFYEYNYGGAPLFSKIIVTGLCGFFVLFYMMSLSYGHKNILKFLKNKSTYVGLIAFVGFVCIVLNWSNKFFLVPYKFPEVVFLVTPLGKYFLAFSMILIVLTLIRLENLLRSIKSIPGKTKKWPFFVLMSIFSFGVFVLSQMMMYSVLGSKLITWSLIVVTTCNVLLTIYFLKDEAKQYDIQIGREAVYSSVMVFIVGAYLLIIGVIGKIVQIAGGSTNLFLSFFAALAVFCLLLAMLVSKSLKNRIRFFIDKNFYMNRYDYREQWGNFSENLSAVVNLDEVLTAVMNHIAGIQLSDNITIFLKNESENAFIIKRTTNEEIDYNFKVSTTSKFINWLYRSSRPVEFSSHELNGLMTKTECYGFNNLHSSICVPMIVRMNFIGLILLGRKETGGAYSKEDIELLETLANQSSMAILNAQLNENILSAKEMESFQKISSFVIHDLKNSITMLSMVTKNAEVNWHNSEFQKDVLITISNAVTKMKTIISRISSPPNKLEPKYEKTDINHLIKKVIKKNYVENLNNIHLIMKFEDMSAMSVDSELIEKVLENLIINAIEALPTGGEIHISTKTERHSVSIDSSESEYETAVIEIADNGIGMTKEFIQNKLFKPFQTTKKKGLGIGLYHCKEIITAHNGSIEIKSEENEGTRFKISLPISNGGNADRQMHQVDYSGVLSLN